MYIFLMANTRSFTYIILEALNQKGTPKRDVVKNFEVKENFICQKSTIQKMSIL